MIYFKNRNGEVFAYETQSEREAFGAVDLVAMTQEEIEAHLNPAAIIGPDTIAARRYQAEVAGITISGMRVETDDRAKLLINGAAVEAMLDAEYVMQWKTPEGFVELTGAQVIAIARAVRAHVQACFDLEAELLAELEAGTLTEDMLEQGWPVA